MNFNGLLRLKESKKILVKRKNSKKSRVQEFSFILLKIVINRNVRNWNRTRQVWNAIEESIRIEHAVTLISIVKWWYTVVYLASVWIMQGDISDVQPGFIVTENVLKDWKDWII